MKAAIVTAANKTPVYGDFATPTAKDREELITVHCSALSHFSKSRAGGGHYSSEGSFPLIAGADGVGTTQAGRRVYFVLPDAPYGALAEICPVSQRRIIELPDALDDVTAAAIANPGMSVWAALMERGQFKAGETVLINGATGTAGRLAVQVAKHMGAAKVVATGRNEEELEEVSKLGADVTIPFRLGAMHPGGAKAYAEALKTAIGSGVDVVMDYVFGESLETIIAAVVEIAEDARPTRIVHVGGVSREQTIKVAGAALRGAAITLMGSGVGSVDNGALLGGIQKIFELAGPAGLRIATKTVPLASVADVWDKAEGKPRLVFTIQ